MKVAVAVARIKRFHGYRDQKIALSGMANALASRCMAHTLGLMQRMGHMIGQTILSKNPLAVCRRGKRRKRKEQARGKASDVHKR